MLTVSNDKHEPEWEWSFCSECKPTYTGILPRVISRPWLQVSYEWKIKFQTNCIILKELLKLLHLQFFHISLFRYLMYTELWYIGKLYFLISFNELA